MSVVEIIKDRDGEGVKYQVQCPETDLLTWHWIHYSNLHYMCDEEYNPMQLANISEFNLIDLLNNHIENDKNRINYYAGSRTVSVPGEHPGESGAQGSQEP